MAPTPVTTVYERPTERVLFDPVRDANPFFHFFEALWMLSGRNDARWLDRFVKDFSSRFAEEDGIQHGAYGYRWRYHFDVEGGGRPGLPDQLETAVQLLRANPADRRVVLTMWDPVADLGVDRRDVPCNTHAYLRVRTERSYDPTLREFVQGLDGERLDVTTLQGRAVDRSFLDLTVCCRSNDAIWGAYGANAVHFSVLQEYLAGRIGVGVGRMYQVSNNFHAYVGALEKVGEPDPGDPYVLQSGTVSPSLMGQNWDHWDEDLARFMECTGREDLLGDGINTRFYRNEWFGATAEPLFSAHWCWKQGYQQDAFTILDNAEDISPDWCLAAHRWFERRLK